MMKLGDVWHRCRLPNDFRVELRIMQLGGGGGGRGLS